MPRNPPWSRDELILALDLYFRVNPIHTSEQHSEIITLSNVLNALPIHPPADQGQSFRNPTGVYMKLCNFLRFDPTYSGKGLTAGSKLDETIWHEYAGNKQRLQQVAAAILENSSHIAPPSTEEEVQSEYEAPEGQILTRIHLARERNQVLVKKKKTLVLKSHGKLKCEVCLFDFEARYGVLGRGFAECHHQLPISALKPGTKTRLSDLAIVCANCHRMIHRAKPWLSVSVLREKLQPQGGSG